MPARKPVAVAAAGESSPEVHADAAGVVFALVLLRAQPQVNEVRPAPALVPPNECPATALLQCHRLHLAAIGSHAVCAAAEKLLRNRERAERSVAVAKEAERGDAGGCFRHQGDGLKRGSVLRLPMSSSSRSV